MEDGNLFLTGGIKSAGAMISFGHARYKTADDRWDDLGTNPRLQPFEPAAFRGCGIVKNNATGKV